MRENTDQINSEYGHLLRSVRQPYLIKQFLLICQNLVCLYLSTFLSHRKIEPF